MLKQRILSAIVMILLVLLALFSLSPLPFTLTLAVLIVLGMWEWAQFAGLKRSVSRAIVAFTTFGLLLFPIMAATQQIQASRFLTDETTPLLFLGCLWWLFALFLVVRYPTSAKWWTNSISSKFIFGICTLLPFFIGTLALRFYQYNTDEYRGVWLLMYVFLLVWGADSGAYFVGKALGKHKLAPQVSPGKSIEGAFGGLLTSALIAFAFLHFSPENVFGREITLVPFMVLSAITVAVSILGDLTESMFKRQVGIKDSSQLIPGHGGILDRIDSLTAAVPVFATGFFFLV